MCLLCWWLPTSCCAPSSTLDERTVCSLQTKMALWAHHDYLGEEHLSTLTHCERLSLAFPTSQERKWGGLSQTRTLEARWQGLWRSWAQVLHSTHAGIQFCLFGWHSWETFPICSTTADPCTMQGLLCLQSRIIGHVNPSQLDACSQRGAASVLYRVQPSKSVRSSGLDNWVRHIAAFTASATSCPQITPVSICLIRNTLEFLLRLSSLSPIPIQN